MAQNDYINMFKDMGIDPRSEEQILDDRRKQRLQAALAAANPTNPTYPGERDIRQGGASLGAALAMGVMKPQLSPQEQALVDARAAADKKVGLMRAGGAFGTEEQGYDAVKMGEQRQMFIAEELIKEGDPRGVQMAQQIDQVRRARQKDQIELEQAGLDLTTSRAEFVEQIYDFEEKKVKAKMGELTPIYRRNSDDPNSSQIAFINDAGEARIYNESGDIATIPLGEYTTVRPDAPDASGGGGGDDPYAPTRTEQKEIRALQRSVMNQMHLGIVIRDALADAVRDDGSINIMDGAGSLLGASIKLANNVNAMVRTGIDWVGFKDDNGEPIKGAVRLDGSTESATKWVKSNADLLEALPIPESIKGEEAKILRYKAAIVQMAYAKARSNEPGARQLSDNDFKNAVMQIGAAATEPDALREVLYGDVFGAVKQFEIWRQQIGVDRANQIIDAPAWKLYEKQYEAFNTAFERPFGFASHAGEGLLNIPEEERAIPGHTEATPTAPAAGWVQGEDGVWRKGE